MVSWFGSIQFTTVWIWYTLKPNQIVANCYLHHQMSMATSSTLLARIISIILMCVPTRGIFTHMHAHTHQIWNFHFLRKKRMFALSFAFIMIVESVTSWAYVCLIVHRTRYVVVFKDKWWCFYWSWCLTMGGTILFSFEGTSGITMVIFVGDFDQPPLDERKTI